MLVAVADHQDGTVTVSFFTGAVTVSALDVPTDIALRALAALTQGRSDRECPFYLVGEGNDTLHIQQGNFRTLASLNVSESLSSEAAKALARVACILTDNNTEGE